MGYERATIERAGGYVPGEQPDAEGIIKLNTNENPYPPAPALADALHAFDVCELRRYPHPTALTFRETAARLHAVSPDSVLATNGGDELLRLALATFVEPGERIGYASPSYSLYPVLAELHGAEVFEVPLTEKWGLPEGFSEQMNAAEVKLTFLVNPHAPSGTLLEVSTISDVAVGLNGVLVVDEAYVDFVDPQRTHDSVGLIESNDNVLILRTLSKGYSLAGLRFGYGLAAPSLLEPIQTKTKDSYNTDRLGQLLATTALEAREYAETTWAEVRHERARMAKALKAREMTVEPSQANFLLVTIAPSSKSLPPAPQVFEQLKAGGILVRYFNAPRLENSLRITIGTPEENDALLKAVDGLRA